MIETGDMAPDFTLPASGGGEIRLHALRPAWVVLYFYPKDNTPGCTTEALEFTALAKQFDTLGARVFGISKDSLAQHEKFIGKHDLGIRLLSDENGAVCAAYGTWVEKNMYGRRYMGIARTTFLIAPDGRIARIWHKVRARGHASAVLEALQAAAPG